MIVQRQFDSFYEVVVYSFDLNEKKNLRNTTLLE
jgi:hypothetical protein